MKVGPAGTALTSALLVLGLATGCAGGTPTADVSSPGEPERRPPAVPKNCAVKPSACGFPDATNTGTTGTLRVINGSVDLRTDGEVLENVEIRGGHVGVFAKNVTVRNVKIINNGDDWGIGLYHSANVTIDRCEIAPDPGKARLAVGIKDVYGDATGTTIKGCDIARTSTGVQTHEGLVADSYIHDMGYQAPDHINGLCSNGSTEPFTIRHNTIFNQIEQTDAIALFQDFGPEANRTITDNLLAGGGYTIYAGGGGRTPTHDIVITNNRIARIYSQNGGGYGPVAKWEDGPGNVWSNNIWDDTLQQIPSG